MKHLRAGLIGIGQMGRNHVRVLHAMEGVELVAVADKAGDPHGLVSGIPVVASAEELIAHNLDMCVIAIPTVAHVEAGLLMAEAGVHTMVEKPLAGDLASADRLIEAFEAAGVVACVGHIERFNPAIRAMRERIGNGEMGSLFQISTRRQGPFVARVDDVGVIHDLGTHDLDLTMWLADRPILAVAARTAHKMGREDEDLAAITSWLQDGVVGNHLVNWLSPFKERLIEVTGESGCLVANTLTADLTFWANGTAPVEWNALQHIRGVTEGNVVRYAIDKLEPLVLELQAFREACLGRRSDVVSLFDGRRALAVAEACLSSASVGRTVALQLTESTEGQNIC